MALVVIDVVLVAVQLATKDMLPLYAEELIDIMTLLFSAYFCAEVTLRIIGQGSVLTILVYRRQCCGCVVGECSSDDGLKCWIWWWWFCPLVWLFSLLC